MNKKEITELKKMFAINNVNLTRISTCYVTHEKEKLFPRTNAFLSLPEEEMFKYLDIFRKCLSGTIGKNLFNIACDSKDSGHGDIERLRKSRLSNDDMTDAMFDAIIESYNHVENYLIVMIHGAYDVPGKGLDGQLMDDASDYVYEYIMTCICPVKLSDAALSVDYKSEAVKDRERDWVVGAPINGILYPAFNDRNEDVNNALFFAKKPDEKQELFLETLLGSEYPLTQKESKNWFAATVNAMANENCAFEVAKQINEELVGYAAELQEGEPAVIDKQNLEKIIKKCGFEDDKVRFFNEFYDETVGCGKAVSISNITDTKSMTVECDNCKVKIDSEYADSLTTQMVDGRLCLVIPLNNNNVEVNGIPVKTGKLSD